VWKVLLQKGPVKGLQVFEIRAGYMEVIDVAEILKEKGIYGKNYLLRHRRHIYREFNMESFFLY